MSGGRQAGDDAAFEVALHRKLAAQPTDLDREAALLQGAFDDGGEMLRGKGLLDEVVGAVTHRLHRGRNIVVAGNQDDRQIGIIVLEIRAVGEIAADEARRLLPVAGSGDHAVRIDQVGLADARDGVEARQIGAHRVSRGAAAIGRGKEGHDVVVAPDGERHPAASLDLVVEPGHDLLQLGRRGRGQGGEAAILVP